MIAHSPQADIFGVATAAHVVAHAHEWELPIRIETSTGKHLTVKATDRAIFIDADQDTAAIVFDRSSLELPTLPAELIPADKVVKVGVEIGWVGFPSMSLQNLCFFSGRVSARIGKGSAYLVDGVAINGVSGGPALWMGYDEFQYIGVVSAYIPNRATGEPLPGLAVIQNVTQFHGIIEDVRSIGEAQSKQATAADAAAAAPATPPSPALRTPDAAVAESSDSPKVKGIAKEDNTHKPA